MPNLIPIGCQRERIKTCNWCPCEVKTNGPSRCSRGLRPGRLPWPHWRDEDPEKPEEVKVIGAIPNVGMTTFALENKVQQLTGLTQHLRNELAELKAKKARRDSI